MACSKRMPDHRADGAGSADPAWRGAEAGARRAGLMQSFCRGVKCGGFRWW